MFGILRRICSVSAVEKKVFIRIKTEYKKIIQHNKIIRLTCFDMYITARPENCHSLFKRGYTTSGIMTIYPWDECDRNYRSIDVFGDMDTSGGGWTVSMTLKK